MELVADKRAKALIFDLDGTLSDSLPVHIATWQLLGNSLGFVFENRLVYEMTGKPTIMFAERLIEENHLTVTSHELVRMKQQAFWDSVHLIKPIDLVVNIVKQNFGKLPMAVGTGASQTSAMLQLRKLNLVSFFDAIVTADDVTKHKPEPDTFLKCAELLGVKPADCQVFEDGILGMEAGRAAGMMVTDVRPFINYGSWALS